MADLTHLQGAVAQAGERADGAKHDHWGGPPVMPHIPVLHDAWAAELERRLIRGDEGGAITFLHRLRYDPPEGFDVWRFLGQVAARLAQKGR